MLDKQLKKYNKEQLKKYNNGANKQHKIINVVLNKKTKLFEIEYEGEKEFLNKLLKKK